MVSARLFFSRSVAVRGSWRYRGACHCSFVGRVHQLGGLPPAQSEKAESWPLKDSGSPGEPRGAQISPQRLQCMYFVFGAGASVVSCDENSAQEVLVQGGPRFRGVTASLGRAESVGKQDGSGSIPSTWSECCPRSRSRCTAREGKGVSLMQATQEMGLMWLLLNYSPLP